MGHNKTTTVIKKVSLPSPLLVSRWKYLKKEKIQVDTGKVPYCGVTEHWGWDGGCDINFDSMKMGLEYVSLDPSTQLHSEGAGFCWGGRKLDIVLGIGRG